MGASDTVAALLCGVAEVLMLLVSHAYGSITFQLALDTLDAPARRRCFQFLRELQKYRAHDGVEVVLAFCGAAVGLLVCVGMVVTTLPHSGREAEVAVVWMALFGAIMGFAATWWVARRFLDDRDRDALQAIGMFAREDAECRKLLAAIVEADEESDSPLRRAYTAATAAAVAT
ncbi:hypothetical protein HY632_05200 [Candidatus Uhrbacteria bacterium]|nr:hypothetical protein [Candidatus Uhrbacteria bacterium]